MSFGWRAILYKKITCEHSLVLLAQRIHKQCLDRVSLQALSDLIKAVNTEVVMLCEFV